MTTHGNDAGTGHHAWTGRVEDDALLRGLGRYGDDVRPDEALAAVFVRSPHAHAAIRGIDVTDARAAPGVVAVFTGADLRDLGTVSAARPVPDRTGRMTVSPFRPVLAADRATHVGEPVALVIATTRAAAEDGAELVAVDWDPLPAVATAEQALAPDAPALGADGSGNVAFDFAAPAESDAAAAEALDRAFAQAAHVARITVENQRLVVAAMEPRTATAAFDPATGRFTLRCPTQGTLSMRLLVAGALKIPPDRIRVLTEDVGGAFGMKGQTYPEYAALLFAARAVGRPVHWVSSRSEAFLTDTQGRDSTWAVELALDPDGRFLGLRVDGLANLGAYLLSVSHLIAATHITGCLPTIYDIPAMRVRSRGVLTNTGVVAPYRGAGRPEANYLLERVIDVAAADMGIDRAEIRRRNLIARDRMPYRTAFANVYDDGDFPAIFERALALADYAGFPARKAAAEARGRLRGIGIGGYLEIAGAVPEEPAAIAFVGGRIEVRVGAVAAGQGHATVFRALAADHLGVPADIVHVTAGDTDRDVPGMGAVGSRSATMTGGAIALAARATRDKAARIAAMLFQAGEADVRHADGVFTGPAPGQRLSLVEIAERARDLAAQGAIAEDLDTVATLKAASTFPNGCHVAEVEVDPETGVTTVMDYVAVDDCGTVLDHTIVEGQIHGGVAQGLGQALMEATVYDPETGQLLSGSFMDYAMPRADDMPGLRVVHHPVACKTNPLGAKGTGEAGTTAAPCALMNAIMDALPRGARLDMPATPSRVWEALQAVTGQAPTVAL
jgi:aerobic carbon-monoxide dehydrogenase large subunit